MNITNLTSYYYHEAALKQTCPSTWRSYWDKYTVATCTHRPATSPKTCVWRVNTTFTRCFHMSHLLYVLSLQMFVVTDASHLELKTRSSYRTVNVSAAQNSQSCKLPATEDREWASEALQQVSARSIRMAPNFFPQPIWTNVTVLCSRSQQHPLLPALTALRIFSTIHTRAFKWSQGTTCRICQNNNCQLFTSETPGAIRQLQLSEQPSTRVLFD